MSLEPRSFRASAIFEFGVWFGYGVIKHQTFAPSYRNLKVFISSSKMDTLATNKTKLDSSIHDYEIHLPGFGVLWRDHLVNGRNGGGVCIYLLNNINYHIQDDQCDEPLGCLVHDHILNPY